MARPTALAGPALLDRPTGRRGLFEREDVLGYALLLPTFVIMGLFLAYPFVYGLWLSLTDSRIGTPGSFVGLGNYVRLFTRDTIFRETVFNTFNYTIVTTIFKFALGMAVALALNLEFRGKRFARAAVLLPFIVPTVLSTLAWLWMFDSTYSVFNWVLQRLFDAQGPQWLADPPWPMASLMIVNVWRGFPFYAISFLAGMQTVPEELYEAAAIDGAGFWRKFVHVTFPLIIPVTTVVTLLSVILTFADFQVIYVLTRGGPANHTHVFATYAYQVGLNGTQIGMGAAVSLVMFPVLAVVVFATLWLLRRGD